MVRHVKTKEMGTTQGYFPWSWRSELQNFLQCGTGYSIGLSIGGSPKMKTSFAVNLVCLIVLAVGCSVPSTKPFADPRTVHQGTLDARDPGCEALALVSQVEPFPEIQRRSRSDGPDILILRLFLTARSSCSTPILIAAVCSHRSVSKLRM